MFKSFDLIFLYLFLNIFISNKPKMASLRVNDVFEELSEENKRLLNELMFANKCLKVLITFKSSHFSKESDFRRKR